MERKIIALALATALLGCLLPQAARAQWFNDPYNGMTILTNQVGTDHNPQIVRLASGRYLVVWLRSSIPKVKYQMLDEQGNCLMGPTGAALFEGNWQYGSARHLIPDGEGGAMCVVADERNGEREVFGQRFDAQGTPLWGANGLPLVIWPGDVGINDVAYDSSGGFFISWTVDAGYNNVDLYTQKFDIEGNRLWGDYGVPVSTLTGNQVYGEIVPDEEGGVIGVFESGSDMSYYLYVQHLDENGTPLFAVNGIPVLSPSGSQLSVGGLVDGVTDGQGGGVWLYKTTGSNNYVKLFRLNGQGATLWLWTSPNYANHGVGLLLRHYADGTIWGNIYENSVEYLYRWDIRGNALFGAGGLPYGGGKLMAVSDGVIAFQVAEVSQGTRFYGARISFAGRLIWSSNIGLGGLTPGGGTIFHEPAPVSDGSDGAVVAFIDSRNQATDPDISAQRVRYDGSLANPPIPVLRIGGTLQGLEMLPGNQVQWVLPQAGQVNLELFDLLGRKIATLQEGYQEAGTHTVNFSQMALPSGIYLLKLQTPLQAQVGKIIIAK